MMTTTVAHHHPEADIVLARQSTKFQLMSEESIPLRDQIDQYLQDLEVNREIQIYQLAGIIIIIMTAPWISQIKCE